MKPLFTEKDKKLFEYSSKELALNALEELNCPFELDEKLVYFIYQGKNFIIKPLEEQVIMIYCYEYKIALDNPNIPVLKDIVNKINSEHFLLSSFYVENQETNLFIVINKLTTLLTSEISNVKRYIENLMSMFFNAEKDIELEFEKQNGAQKQNTSFKIKGGNKNNGYMYLDGMKKSEIIFQRLNRKDGNVSNIRKKNKPSRAKYIMLIGILTIGIYLSNYLFIKKTSIAVIGGVILFIGIVQHLYSKRKSI